MGDVKPLVASIIHFLNEQMQNGSLSSDAAESLEVAVQCLESAFGVSANDESLRPSTPLQDVYNEYTKGSVTTFEPPPEASSSDKEEAERLKNEGNSLMREEKFQEALDCYTRAIALDGRNAIFYCNRAAVHSKLNNFQQAISDGQRALKIDPSYSKAYARLGLAYANLGLQEEARTAYAKALELEPDNESYRNNLQLAQASQFLAGPGASNLGPINSILRNSDLMSMASEMLSDPTMQNLISGLVSTNSNQGGNTMDALLRAGQQIAQHMQDANPELVEQLRRQLDTQGQSNGAGDGSQPPSNPPPSQ